MICCVYLTGYRSVPLKNEYSEPHELASLLVFIEMRNPKVRDHLTVGQISIL